MTDIKLYIYTYIYICCLDYVVKMLLASDNCKKYIRIVISVILVHGSKTAASDIW